MWRLFGNLVVTAGALHMICRVNAGPTNRLLLDPCHVRILSFPLLMFAYEGYNILVCLHFSCQSPLASYFVQIKDYLLLLFLCFLCLLAADWIARRSLSNPLQRIPAAIVSKVSNSAKREGNHMDISTVTYTLLMTSRSGRGHRGLRAQWVAGYGFFAQERGG